MIPRKKVRTDFVMSDMTWKSLQVLARHNKRAEFSDLLFRWAKQYIADVRDTDFVDDEIFVNVKDQTFECECPNCHSMLELNMEELAK